MLGADPEQEEAVVLHMSTTAGVCGTVCLSNDCCEGVQKPSCRHSLDPFLIDSSQSPAYMRSRRRFWEEEVVHSSTAGGVLSLKICSV